MPECTCINFSGCDDANCPVHGLKKDPMVQDFIPGEKMKGMGYQPIGELDFEDEADALLRPGRIEIGPHYSFSDGFPESPKEDPNAVARKHTANKFIEAIFKSTRVAELTLLSMEKEAKLNTWINLIKSITIGSILMWLMFYT